MMNLEILFVGAEITGNDAYRQHAISHANKTMKNHIRSDGMFVLYLPSCSLSLNEFDVVR
jgi:hypothetical protein